MNKIVLILSCLFIFATGAMAAGGAVQVPTASGNDVIVPGKLIDTVAKGVSNPVIVAVMHDAVGDAKEVKMLQEGGNWIAPGARGADFHPALKTKDGYVWAKIENVWSTGADFVKNRNAGPCLFVK